MSGDDFLAWKSTSTLWVSLRSRGLEGRAGQCWSIEPLGRRILGSRSRWPFSLTSCVS